jgi:hypothetical protein
MESVAFIRIQLVTPSGSVSEIWDVMGGRPPVPTLLMTTEDCADAVLNGLDSGEFSCTMKAFCVTTRHLRKLSFRRRKTASPDRTTHLGCVTLMVYGFRGQRSKSSEKSMSPRRILG